MPETHLWKASIGDWVHGHRVIAGMLLLLFIYQIHPSMRIRKAGVA